MRWEGRRKICGLESGDGGGGGGQGEERGQEEAVFPVPAHFVSPIQTK